MKAQKYLIKLVMVKQNFKLKKKVKELERQLFNLRHAIWEGKSR